MVQDILTDTLKFPVYLPVGVAQNPNPFGSEIVIPNQICSLTGLLIMLRAIHLDNQLRLSDVKIRNVRADHLLTVNHHWKISQKIVPKMPFLFCHAFAQFSCIAAKPAVI